MSFLNSSVRAKIVQGSSPTIYNVSVVLASTEYSQALNPQAKKFTIRVRGISKLQLAYSSGGSSTNFITIPPGASLTEENVDFAGTLYFQCNKAAQVVEIEEWV